MKGKKLARESAKEFCEDAISRLAVFNVLHEIWGDSGELIDYIKDLPSVRPARLRGKWITAEAETRNLVRYVCSSCDEYWDITGRIFPYCPECGSYNGVDMRESEEE